MFWTESNLRAHSSNHFILHTGEVRFREECFSIVESHPTTHSKVEFVARIPYLLYHQASFHSEGKPTALSVLPCLRQSSVLIVEYFSDWEIQKNYKEYNWKGKLPLGHVIMQIPTTFNSTMKERCSLPAALGRLFKDLL